MSNSESLQFAIDTGISYLRGGEDYKSMKNKNPDLSEVESDVVGKQFIQRITQQ